MFALAVAKHVVFVVLFVVAYPHGCSRRARGRCAELAVAVAMLVVIVAKLWIN